MSCDPIRSVIPLYVEGDLPGRRGERVRRHLESCLSCRSLLEGYKASQRSLHTLGAPRIEGETLDRLRRSVWKRIGTLPPRSALGRRVDRAWAALRQWTAQPAMAALMVFVVVGGSFALSRVNRPGPRPELHGGALRADEVVASEEALFDNAAADVDEGAELIAQATFDEAADVGEPPAEPASDEGSGNDDSLRIEI